MSDLDKGTTEPPAGRTRDAGDARISASTITASLTLEASLTFALAVAAGIECLRDIFGPARGEEPLPPAPLYEALLERIQENQGGDLDDDLPDGRPRIDPNIRPATRFEEAEAAEIQDRFAEGVARDEPLCPELAVDVRDPRPIMEEILQGLKDAVGEEPS